MHATAVILNAVISLASAWWAIVALTSPEKLSGTTVPVFGERYFARLYAVRSIMLELASAIAPFVAHGNPVVGLLLGAAAVQAADAAIGAKLESAI